MEIRNNEKDRHETGITIHDFGRAMAALDLSAIPPENRNAALMDHLAGVMSKTIKDPDISRQIGAAQRLRQLLR